MGNILSILLRAILRGFGYKLGRDAAKGLEDMF